MAADPHSALTERPSGKRPRLLIALQTEATIFLGLAIGQAGFAAAFLTGQKSLKAVHAVDAYLMSAVAVIMLITAMVYRRRGGPRWAMIIAAVLVLAIGVQITLGLLELAAVHIFFGVLYVAFATVFVSYLFRPGYGIPSSSAQ